MVSDGVENGGNGVDRKQTQQLVVVDEHPMVCEWLAQNLRSEGDLRITCNTENLAGAIAAIERLDPQLVITELSLSDAPGIDVVRSLKARFPTLAQLVFSRHDEEQCAEAVIAAGARGFVSKRECGPIVRHAIRRVLAGEVYVSSRIAARVLDSFASGRHPAAASPREVLSRRELEAFTLLGEGCKASEIAQKMGVGVKTVESYNTRIREKLGLENARELFRSAVDWAKRPIK